uniref:Phorbol-ester/DAG-type domain-containing protein n=1 Tax=Panagrellus redivivus TaxID=6233 RepID=A0A7E4V0H7_PANRE
MGLALKPHFSTRSVCVDRAISTIYRWCSVSRLTSPPVLYRAINMADPSVQLYISEGSVHTSKWLADDVVQFAFNVVGPVISAHVSNGLQWPQLPPAKSSALMEAPLTFANQRRRSFSQISIDSRKEPDLLDDWIQVAQIGPIRDAGWENERGYQGELFQLRMTNEIMKKMEAINWAKFTKGIDFSTDPGPILCQYAVPVRTSEPQHEASPAEVALPAEEGVYDVPPAEEEEEGPEPESEAVFDDEQPCSSRSLMNREFDPPVPKAMLEESASDGENFMQTDVEVDDDVATEFIGTSTTKILLDQFAQKTRDVQHAEELLSLANTAERLDSFSPVQPLGTPTPEDELYEIDGKRVRLRGSAIWAPPRGKFIFDLPESRDTPAMLTLQNNLCAGCGMKFTKIYARRAKVCGYYNKLFCQCCFSGEKARIPARILHNWNFKEYPVSDFASRFLSEHEDHPVYNVTAVNPELFKSVKQLKRFKTLRIKASHMWQFVQTCPYAEREDEFPDYGVLKTMFTSVPRRFFRFEELDIYSMLDFLAIENGNLLDMLRPIVDCGKKHIESCQSCRQRSFICSVCMNQNELLYPFQLEKSYQCDACGDMMHLRCYKRVKKNWRCARCDRIRRKSPVSDSGSLTPPPQPNTIQTERT